MKNICLLCVAAAGAALLGGAGVGRAHAALGERAESVAADQASMGGQLSTTSGAGYTVHEITAQGRRVREYVSADGMVFAVVWHGSTPPDLSQLLGSYYGEYRAAAEKAPVALRYSKVSTNHVVVERGGHMRDLWGRAIAPSLVPAGVSEAQIR